MLNTKVNTNMTCTRRKTSDGITSWNFTRCINTNECNNSNNNKIIDRGIPDMKPEHQAKMSGLEMSGPCIPDKL